MSVSQNTFSDFLACAQHLKSEGLAHPDLMCISGRSAGGLLIGAVLNRAPARPDGKPYFAGAVAGVPFVDVLTTMLDPSIPLTVVEYEEWGNPQEERYFKYISEYCPVSNVRADQVYPPLLLTAGLNDPRVGYWEPLKVSPWKEKGKVEDRGLAGSCEGWSAQSTSCGL